MLCLLPGAPRELIDGVYAALRVERADDRRLRDAYETITRALERGTFVVPPQSDTPSHRASPWELLQLRAEAPRAAVDAAYRFWRGDAPVVPTGSVAAASRSPRAGSAVRQPAPPTAEDQAPVVPTGSVAAASRSPRAGSAVLSAYEELLGVSQGESASPLPRAGEGSGVRVEQEAAVDVSPISAYEELLVPREDDRGSPPPAGEELGERSVQPALVGEDGTTVPLAERPLRIGTQPACDIVVRAAGRIEARVWRNKGRFLVHALGPEGAVLLNGSPLTWAALDEGDLLTVGPASFRFAAPKTT